MRKKFKYWKTKTKDELYREEGMTLYETIFALVMMFGLFILVLNVFSVSIDKSTYIAADKNIISGELNISEWLEKDFKEHKVDAFKVKNDSAGNPTMIVLTVEKTIDSTSTSTGDTSESTEPVLSTDTKEDIVYRNREDGYFRITDTQSTKLFDHKVSKVVQKGNLINITYRLGTGDKIIKFKLDK